MWGGRGAVARPGEPVLRRACTKIEVVLKISNGTKSISVIDKDID